MRGAAGSAASYAGAFAMVPNAALMGVGGALAAEVWMTGILVFLIMALTDADTGSVPDAAAPSPQKIDLAFCSRLCDALARDVDALRSPTALRIARG